MIFVTVGTHEQQFNRLVQYMDNWSFKHDEEVFIQYGFSTVNLKYCTGGKMLSYDQMQKKIKEARIVITHGGPSSFYGVLNIGKIPIVVPRKSEYKEHVNNHQCEFCKAVYLKYKSIICVDDINDLSSIIENFTSISNDIKNNLYSNNTTFNNRFSELIERIL